MLSLVLTLVLPFAAQDSPLRHVRATEPSILALINDGLSRSATFRDLVATLNTSDVIVYVEPKRTRPNLGGYLAHQVVAHGDHRYLRIAIDTRGSRTASFGSSLTSCSTRLKWHRRQKLATRRACGGPSPDWPCHSVAAERALKHRKSWTLSASSTES